MTYIPPSNKQEFEKVKIDEWISGEICDIQEFKNVEKEFTNDDGEREKRIINQVRFKFTLDGYKYPHYSRKMTASMNERSNLFMFLQKLYGDTIIPDIAVELDKLKGLRVKTMWEQVKLKDGTIFQYPDKIRALDEKLPDIWDIPDDYNKQDNDVPEIDNNPFKEDVPF